MCTLWVTGHEFSFRSLQTRTWSPGRNGSSTHVIRFLAEKRGFCARNHQSVPVGDCLQPVAVGLRSGGRSGGRACCSSAPALIVVSASGKTLFRTLSLAIARIILSRVESALHHEPAVDSLRWFADFAMEKRWHSWDAVYQQLQGLIQIWYTAGTYDRLNL